MVSFSMMFRGILKRGVNGPSAFSISFRFWVSVLLIAPISGDVNRYVMM